MTRPEREQWGELRKFMQKIKTKYPTSQCFLKKTTLFVDNRSDSFYVIILNDKDDAIKIFLECLFGA